MAKLFGIVFDIGRLLRKVKIHRILTEKLIHSSYLAIKTFQLKLGDLDIGFLKSMSTIYFLSYLPPNEMERINYVYMWL